MQNMIDSVSKYKNTFLVGQVASRWVLSPRKSDFWGTPEISGTADTPTGAEREMNGMASLIHGCVPVGESISNRPSGDYGRDDFELDIVSTLVVSKLHEAKR